MLDPLGPVLWRGRLWGPAKVYQNRSHAVIRESWGHERWGQEAYAHLLHHQLHGFTKQREACSFTKGYFFLGKSECITTVSVVQTSLSETGRASRAPFGAGGQTLLHGEASRACVCTGVHPCLCVRTCVCICCVCACVCTHMYILTLSAASGFSGRFLTERYKGRVSKGN